MHPNLRIMSVCATKWQLSHQKKIVKIQIEVSGFQVLDFTKLYEKFPSLEIFRP